MATFTMGLAIVLVLGALIPAVSPTNINVATEEMATANYFTFSMLVNMASLDPRIQENVTFLMPNDRMLSSTTMSQGDVSDFLLRHSIPSPMLFNHLLHIPTGSTIPSSLPDYMLKISNNGRRNYTLNNVKIISPNICTMGSSIRCHGIDGVLLPITTIPENKNTTHSPLPSCSNSSSPPPAAVATPPPSAPSVQSPPSPVSPLDPTPATAPTPTPEIAPTPTPTQSNSSPQKSGSSPWLSYEGLLKFLVTCGMVLIVGSI